MNERDAWTVLEEQIVRDCQNQSIDAYKKIYQRYEQPLLRTAMRLLGRPQEAEDAVQMTFVKLYKGIKNYKFKAKFSTYLFKILIRTCFDLQKKTNRLKTKPYEPRDAASSSSPDLKIVLEEAVFRLPSRMRTCFVLHVVEGMPQNEIAEILNLSIGGVKSNVYHAKVRLRSFLSPRILDEERS